MKSLSVQQVEALIAVAGKHSERDALMFRVAFNHALRASELLAMSTKNIVDGFVVVQRLKGSKKTVQPLLPNERQAVLNLAKSDEPFFPMCRKTLWLKMQKYCAEAGIPKFLAHPHSLRHGCAMAGLQGGMKINELQTYLGHVSGSNTMIYLQVNDDVASSAFARAVGA